MAANTARLFLGPFAASTYKRRRQMLMDGLRRRTSGDFVAYFWSGSEVPRNDDCNFPFRPTSDFLYLTGFSEPECLLILQQKANLQTVSLLLRPRDLGHQRGSEVWDGERLGVERATKILGVDEAFAIEDLKKVVFNKTLEVSEVFWSLGEVPHLDTLLIDTIRRLARMARGLPKIAAVREPRMVLHELRRTKSSEEVAVMRRSAEIGALGHIRGMKALRAGAYEYQVGAEIEKEFKKHGASWVAYNSIVATGNNACTLHYHSNDQKIGPNDLLLVDAGCEYQGYASDITRVYPASGKFTDAQKKLYNVVLRSQLAAIAAAKPGVSILAPHEAAVRVIAQGLVKLGFFKGKNVAQVLRDKLWRAYMMHGTSHWLGMDVHDAGRYDDPKNSKKSVRLSVGNVLTVEPGLYVRAEDKSAPAEFRGIGIRIEDDVLITRSGRDVLSKNCPKTIEEIESLCGPRL